MMRFSYMPDGIDGLVLTDREHLKELNGRPLYELDILLDRYRKKFAATEE